MYKFTSVAVLIVATFACLNAFEKPPVAEKVEAGHAHAAMPEEMAKEMQMMNNKMVKILGKGDAEYEKRFIDMMIPHHEGAILMAQDALKNATQPELKKMAEKMIEDQSKEIKMLKEYRAKWYGNK